MGCMHELFGVFGDFYVPGMQGTKVTKSLFTLDVKFSIRVVYRTRVM